MIIPNKKRIRENWLVNIILSIAALFALFSFGDAAYQQNVNFHQGQQISSLVSHSIAISNRHHTQQVLYDKRIHEEEQVIAFEGATIASQNKEIIAEQQQSHQTLLQVADITAQIEALQADFVKVVSTLPADANALTTGQSQLTAELAAIESKLAALETQLTAIAASGS